VYILVSYVAFYVYIPVSYVAFYMCTFRLATLHFICVYSD